MFISNSNAWLKTPNTFLPLPRIRIKVEEFNSSGLIVDVEDSRSAPSIEVALDDDREERAKHADGLERVRPHDCLDPSDGRVEDADDEDDDDGDVEREAGDLLENHHYHYHHHHHSSSSSSW